MQEAGAKLSEAKLLMRGWTPATFATVADSIRYHFRRHGHAVGASNVWQYLRQAHGLRQTLRGARRTALDAGKVRYTKHRRFLILNAQGRSFPMAQQVETMFDRTLEETVSELQRLLKEDLSKPFPYDDCRRVLARAGDTKADLIPDLDLYFGDIAGYCSWGKKLLRLSEDDLRGVRALLQKSFFEKHPEHLPLVALINETDTPALFAALGLHDKARLQLLAVLAALLSEPAAEPLLADALVTATPGWSVSHRLSSQDRVSE